MKKLLYLFVILAVSTVSAQDFNGTISSYLNSNHAQMGLQQQDVMDISVKSHSFSNSMQLETVYASQNYQGIEIFNSVSSFAVKNSQVVNASMSFMTNLATKINTTNPGISAATAINKAAAALGIPSPSNLELLESSGHSYVFSNGNISMENIPVDLVFQSTEQNNLRLAWDLSIYLLDGSHYYSVRIDAITGTLLDTHDWVSNCKVEHGFLSNLSSYDSNTTSFLFNNSNAPTLNAAGGAQYRVFALPKSNPYDGPDTLENSPSNPTASPFGWHDTDGVGGAEFTITRGNNAWARADLNGNNTGASPDGGGTLDFDFAYGLPQDPGNFTDAATVNLFYLNNMIHDITYQYGFDEASGNFQENNYGNGGNQSDSVNADAQDGSGTNNANFATPPDGANPRMQMFIWQGATTPIQDLLTINNGPLAGTYVGLPGNFGGPMPVPPLTEDLVVIEDDDAGDSTDPNDGCDNVTNGGALNGKIAVIRRGSCEFGFKALAAENEGAVAVIIVNNSSGQLVLMGGGAVGASVTIPVFSMSNQDGEAIIAELNGGGSINGTINATPIPLDRDGDIDNEIVMHEYTHGISNRLTGGPNTVGCLQNAEQMGEGWSDYFALVLTMQPGDQGSDARGAAAYASGDPSGLRSFPYSTDFNVNGQTYASIIGCTFPHCVGEVWAGMLWEMTWELIDDHGFDTDIYNGTGGNNIALQLVMDGLKLQQCSPGFVTGRNAILLADQLSNGGANQCAIWDAFARRGLGVGANQGSQNNVNDGTESYDVPTEPGCLLGTADNSFDQNFKIYPNPTDGMINIESLIGVGDATISIFDINGRQVYAENVELIDAVTINATGLSSGLYLVQIEGANYVHTAKIIIK